PMASTSATRSTAFDGFSADERAAMKDHARDLKTAARRGAKATREDGEADVLEKIAEMTQPDRAIAERLHRLVLATAPELTPRLWYGMPAYALDGKLVCHFQPAQKFKSRYATLGFSDRASLDDGAMWPTSFAVTELTAGVESEIRALVTKAVS